MNQAELIQLINSSHNDEELFEVCAAYLSSAKRELLSDSLLELLIEKELCVLELCHMDLSDQWLIRLLEFDDAPLYRLAERWYRHECYSAQDFAEFFEAYLRKNPVLVRHLLELYPGAVKEPQLLELCGQMPEYSALEWMDWYRVAAKVSGMECAQEIREICGQYNTVGPVLKAAAGNPNTPEDVLEYLAQIKNISGAAQIRKTVRSRQRSGSRE